MLPVWLIYLTSAAAGIFSVCAFAVWCFNRIEREETPKLKLDKSMTSYKIYTRPKKEEDAA